MSGAYGPLAGPYDALTGDVPYGALADWYETAFARAGRAVLLAVQGAPQFQSINSLSLYLLYVKVSTICDYWKDHSLDYTDFCCQSDVFAFLTDCLGLQ